MKKSSGLNGFGRFSLHFFKQWLDKYEKSNFTIDYINDEKLSIKEILKILRSDYKVSFKDYKFSEKKKYIIVSFRKKIIKILVTKHKSHKISWIGEPEIFFECSGLNTFKEKSKKFLKNKTKFILISATSYDCDRTIINGFNDIILNNKDRIISYGSCTVNAFTILANELNKKFKILKSDVNVIHNLPRHKILKNKTLIRKYCTLEKMGPKLLNFLNSNNFNVNYTLVPFDGISIMDFHFVTKKKITKNQFLKFIKRNLKNKYYSLSSKDKGPNHYNLKNYNAILIKDSFRFKNNDIYFQTYFDNENSAFQYYNVAFKILKKT